MSSSANFVIGNTYAKIDDSMAKLDRTGMYRKVHDWTLYVDIIGSSHSADLVKKVEFDLGSTFSPSKFTSYCPVKVPESSGHWRFKTRQQSYGAVSAKVVIIGRGGTVLRKEFMVKLSPGGKENGMITFTERHPHKRLIPVPMAKVDFGIELELSTSSRVSSSDVSNFISSKASVRVLDVTPGYAAARTRNDAWVLVPDVSIQCSRDRPGCNKFELVSPILSGGDGLQIVDRVISALEDISTIQVNKSMGFHVHVNVSDLCMSDLTKVCQNFVKYEKAMDSFMPPSRREGNRFCQSNRFAIPGPNSSNKEVHEKLGSCESIQALGNLMSPTKYYKLNLCPLRSGRQPTIEFRQHSATHNRVKIKNWIRFCIAFVHNSAKFREPSFLDTDVDNDELFEMLMMYVVKDRFLRNFYRQRRNEVAINEACCVDCASGTSCETTRR